MPRTFNINTYKFHALGDYKKAIRRFGTTDSYTTRVVSIYHTILLQKDAPTLLPTRVNEHTG